MNINNLSGQIVNTAMNVHRELGPGLLESVYQACLVMELESQGFNAQSEVPQPVLYRGREVAAAGFRMDLLVEDEVVVELKSVSSVQSVHIKQLLTYLRLSKKPLGLLINFNESLLKNGITRVANNL
jgi:GxxExxY protein